MLQIMFYIQTWLHCPDTAKQIKSVLVLTCNDDLTNSLRKSLIGYLDIITNCTNSVPVEQYHIVRS